MKLNCAVFAFRCCSFEELVNRRRKKILPGFESVMLRIELVAGYKFNQRLMKKIVFVSRMQFAFCVVGGLMSATCFVGIFYNTFYILLFAMAIILTIACYKERNW